MPHKFVFLTPFMIWSKCKFKLHTLHNASGLTRTSDTVYTNALLSSLNTAKRANDTVVSVSLNNVTPPRFTGQLSGSNNTQSGQVRDAELSDCGTCVLMLCLPTLPSTLLHRCVCFLYSSPRVRRSRSSVSPKATRTSSEPCEFSFERLQPY